MLGHIGTQFIVMCIQTAVLIVFTLVIFDVYSIGSVLVIIMFELIIGFTGMCLGFLISTGEYSQTFSPFYYLFNADFDDNKILKKIKVMLG